MMKCEFEKLAGYEVSFDTYNNVIEPMYMASNLSKEDFVKSLNKQAFALPTKAQLINKMKKLAKQIKDNYEHIYIGDIEEALYNTAKEVASKLGFDEVILNHKGRTNTYVESVSFYNKDNELVKNMTLA